MTQLDDITDALAVFDVRAGFPHKRQELARHLLDLHVSSDDIALLARHVRGTVRGEQNATRVLATLLADDDALQERLRDLRAVKTVKAAKEQTMTTERPTYRDPTDGDPRYARGVNRRIASTRVRADKRTPQEVADEMGLPLATVLELIEEDRAMREQDLALARQPRR